MSGSWDQSHEARLWRRAKGRAMRSLASKYSLEYAALVHAHRLEIRKEEDALRRIPSGGQSVQEALPSAGDHD